MTVATADPISARTNDVARIVISEVEAWEMCYAH